MHNPTMISKPATTMPNERKLKQLKRFIVDGHDGSVSSAGVAALSSKSGAKVYECISKSDLRKSTLIF